MKYCVVRAYSAGVHIGYVKEFGGKHPQHAKLFISPLASAMVMVMAKAPTGGL